MGAKVVLSFLLCLGLITLYGGCTKVEQQRPKPDPTQSEIDDLFGSMGMRGYEQIYSALDTYSPCGLAAARGSGGWTLLHFAAGAGDTNTARILIENGADVNAKPWSSVTPLHRAVGANALEIARLLIEKGADVNIKTELGETPLHWAAQSASLHMAQLLISNGADVNAKTSLGSTTLVVAAIWDETDSFDPNRAAVVKLLRSNGGVVPAGMVMCAQDVECLHRYGLHE